jgi:hypothetical protein
MLHYASDRSSFSRWESNAAQLSRIMDDVDVAAWSSRPQIARRSSKSKPPSKGDLGFGADQRFGLSAALGGAQLATVHHRRSEREVIAPERSRQDEAL